MNATVAVLSCSLSIVPACDRHSDSPVAPTIQPATSTPLCPPGSCQLLPFHISGVATDDDGRPVAGARVTIRPFIFGQSPPPIVTTTDAAGFYRVEFEGMRDAVGGLGTVLAEQPGHENHWRYLGPSFPQEIIRNFHLYRVKQIRPGEPVSVIVRPDDSACGLDDEWVCRTVRIAAPQGGILKLTLVAHNPQDQTGLEVLERAPSGGFVQRRCCSAEASLHVSAGAEVIANILVWWSTTATHSFTLGTSFVRE
jgi:hypothetical protein